MNLNFPSAVNSSLLLVLLLSSTLLFAESASKTMRVADSIIEGTCSDGSLGADGVCKRGASVSEQSNETVDDGSMDMSWKKEVQKLERQALRGKARCVDEHEMCEFWASKGECDNNPAYMQNSCKKSCDICGSVQRSATRSETHDGIKQDTFDETNFGEIQKIDGQREAETRQKIQEIIEYMHDEVNVKPEFKSVRKECINRHELCAFWAVIGECDNNPAYMVLQCAPSCKTCDKIDIKNRCPMDPEIKDVYGPGEIDKMFEDIVEPDGQFQVFAPVIHSRPTFPKTLSENEEVDYQLGPWVVTLDNFLSEEECDEMIRQGYSEGYERSSDVGKMKFDGTFDILVNDGRTSENAWCNDDCQKHDITKAIEGRMMEVTGIPTENYESLQILKYEVGQYYRTHHDFIDHHVDRQSGPRILTFFLYLSDVEEGGGTNFPKLEPPLTIFPKKGRALIWSHVRSDNPNRKDGRTDHGALPVEAGVKFAANAWIHSKDFKAPNLKGCV